MFLHEFRKKWHGMDCMVQVLHVEQLFSHPGLPWLQTSCFFVSWRNAFLLSLIVSTPPLHSYVLLGTLVPARQVHKMQKTCSWAPFECIAGQTWQKPLWAAISEIYETFSPIRSNHKQSCIPKRLTPGPYSAACFSNAFVAFTFQNNKHPSKEWEDNPACHLKT